ncbi:hypothetical protein SAMN05428989_2827 [Pseudoxanthomonas sp. GM95]|uniref:hypothetical protein n=1 Tax=Pseudoxanthomonas sp. GM95 TaxID=1881043 RepID=UPI0008B10433|nr:hypothetical protein [Pseudoxanthomonas sp. GM95]SEL89902.1 hypothetical protein SAMN05428989_2827 [Pseudoxanthomonas sp. GM95]
MDSRLRSSGTTWLGLTLVALAVVGLMAQLHPQQAAAMPAAMEAAAADVVLKPVLETSTDPTPSPAQDGIHPRRRALSMPYFSFARLLRPGS